MVSILVILVIISLFYICFWGRRSTNNVSGMFKYFKLEEISSIESIFHLSIIKAATSDFSDANKLGEGGFGTVYKGTLPNGEEIAVKRLSARAEQGLLELKNELLLVVKLQHKNLVRLRGICLEEEEKLLVYEFVPNRSLDTILFDPIKSGDLNWEMRFKIIEGIARGLRYLHEESHLKVVHRDLKASNVLLNGDMNPKISDFGLAKLFKGDDSHVTTSRVAGTLGYMPPEYFRQGKFSAKFDIFSFGVLVLEIVTGKKISSFYDSEYAEDLLSYTWDHWKNGTLSEIIDSSLGEHYPINEVSKCIQIGLLCAQVVPADRPFMSSVMFMLHSPLETLKLPLQPTSSAGMHQLYTPRKQSGNEVSISEVHPR